MEILFDISLCSISSVISKLLFCNLLSSFIIFSNLISLVLVQVNLTGLLGVSLELPETVHSVSKFGVLIFSSEETHPVLKTVSYTHLTLPTKA